MISEQTSEKITIVKGILPDKKTHKRFHEMFSGLAISKPQYYAKPPEEAIKDGKFHITLYVREHADLLIRSSLRDGFLRHWGQFFEFEALTA